MRFLFVLVAWFAISNASVVSGPSAMKTTELAEVPIVNTTEASVTSTDVALHDPEKRFFWFFIPAIIASPWYIPVAVTIGGTLAGLPLGLYNTFRKTPGQGTPVATQVRLWVGHDRYRNSTQSLAGHYPEVTLYDEFGDFLGKVAGPRDIIKNGNFYDLWINPKKNNNASPEYVQLIMQHDDPICISAIKVTRPDGTSAMFTGDMAVQYCGWPGYFDTITIVSGDHGASYQPKCFWMEENTRYDECKNGKWTLGRDMPRHISFKIKDMHAANETQKAYTENKELICQNHRRLMATHRAPKKFPHFDPILQYPTNATDKWNNTIKADYLDKKYIDSFKQVDIPYHPCNGKRDDPTDDDLSKDDEPEPVLSRHHTKKWREQNLQKYHISHSTDPGRSATFACQFPNIIGPDWLSMHERKYCDNEHNILYDLCDTKRGIISNCFDLDTEELRGPQPVAANGEVFLALPPATLKKPVAHRTDVDKDLSALVNLMDDSDIVDLTDEL